MVTKYYEIVAARLALGGSDATYGVQFAHETRVGKTWEFDPNSDAVEQYTSKRTGRIKVFFNPVKSTMKFPEDANRRLEYVMPVEDARVLWKFLAEKEPNFWFALDIAFEGELKGYDPELQKCMRNCAGCAMEMEPV